MSGTKVVFISEDPEPAPQLSPQLPDAPTHVDAVQPAVPAIERGRESSARMQPLAVVQNQQVPWREGDALSDIGAGTNISHRFEGSPCVIIQCSPPAEQVRTDLRMPRGPSEPAKLRTTADRSLSC